jgi:hypothetical protein
MKNAALLILFNHNYEANLDRLKTIYESKFDNIYFIMPFYGGTRPDVIPVYENSYYFQGYIARALEALKHKEYEHYIIIGDDLILNPSINQNNYKEYFNVNEDRGFIPGPFLLSDTREQRPYRKFPPFWPWNKLAVNFKVNAKGIEVQKFLPSYNEAKQLLSRHGLHFSPKMSWRFFYGSGVYKHYFTRKKHWSAVKYTFKMLPYLRKSLQYPMIGSYSDIVVVPGKHVEPMIKYCGIFAALGLFVEIALPTALAFSVPEIADETGDNWKGETFWLKDTIEGLETKYEKSLSRLFEKFPDQTLYIHPVKLSRWK